MTIHHDKLAYGKLAPTKKELSDDDILNMLKKLNGENEEDKSDNTENGENTHKHKEK